LLLFSFKIKQAKQQFPVREERNVYDVISMTHNEATRQSSWERGQHCMRSRTRPKPDAARPRPKILPLRPR